MDQRIHDHARTLVDWSARIEGGDDVVVEVGEGAHDLAVAVASQLGEHGANVVFQYAADELEGAYLRAHDGPFAESPTYERELYERADVLLVLRGTRNMTELSDVPAEQKRAYRQARKDIWEARLATDWVSTVHPTHAMAQEAGMSVEAYRSFVYDAVLRDWEALADEMQELTDLLDAGSEVRIVKGDGTDVTLDVTNRTAVNSAASVGYDSHNLPSGEVYTAPASADGEITFDVPMSIQGNRVRDARLVVEDGTVVDWSAAVGEDTLTEAIETDEGSRRLGELGVGMNTGIDRPTGQIMFDEKMRGTVHLALGRSYDVCLPEGETGVDSVVHEDLITEMRQEGTRLEIDGDVIQRNGTFRWEEGFAGA